MNIRMERRKLYSPRHKCRGIIICSLNGLYVIQKLHWSHIHNNCVWKPIKNCLLISKFHNKLITSDASCAVFSACSAILSASLASFSAPLRASLASCVCLSASSIRASMSGTRFRASSALPLLSCTTWLNPEVYVCNKKFVMEDRYELGYYKTYKMTCLPSLISLRCSLTEGSSP